MSKFKVGDRIAVYSDGDRCVRVILGIDNQLISVNKSIPRNLSDGFAYWVHEKQCRLLKKKPKPVKKATVQVGDYVINPTVGAHIMFKIVEIIDDKIFCYTHDSRLFYPKMIFPKSSCRKIVTEEIE